MKLQTLVFATLYLGLFCWSCGTAVPSASAEIADTVYHNGVIITMNDQQQEVEVVAVLEGKIVAAGTMAEVRALTGVHTEVIDLAGRTMIPGFVDAHSHFTLGMKMIAQANLNAPPVDSIKTIPDILKRLQEHQQKLNIPKGQWVLGWGYDPDQLTERRHPTASELSAALPDHPVFIIHTSFHMGVANDQALEMIGINEHTPQPPGGMIVKDFDTGAPTGLLQESAMYMMIGAMPQATAAQAASLLQMTQAYYASHGVTTAQDGLTDSQSYEYLKSAAAQDKLYIDIQALGSYREADYFMQLDEFGNDQNGLRLAGMKITTDGSPQGKTAYFKKSYLTQVPGCTSECRGFPMVQPEELQRLMQTCYQNDIQLYVHCNGDASIDMLLDTHEKVVNESALPLDAQRTVVIHSQFVRPDQLEKYKAYEFIPSFFTNHAFFWGDVHTLNLGKERADFLSPMRSAIDAGITVTNHTDYNVTPINQLFLLWTSVVRQSRVKHIMGPDERITPYEGLKALTINSAYQHHIDHLKGSIEIGKLADLVILDANPLTVDPMAIKDIQVLTTIKEGKVIYQHKGE